MFKLLHIRYRLRSLGPVYYLRVYMTTMFILDSTDHFFYVSFEWLIRQISQPSFVNAHSIILNNEGINSFDIRLDLLFVIMFDVQQWTSLFFKRLPLLLNNAVFFFFLLVRICPLNLWAICHQDLWIALFNCWSVWWNSFVIYFLQYLIAEFINFSLLLNNRISDIGLKVIHCLLDCIC